MYCLFKGLGMGFSVFDSFLAAEKLQNVPVIQTFSIIAKHVETFMFSLPNSPSCLFMFAEFVVFSAAICKFYQIL
jgi:hypothetical protein